MKLAVTLFALIVPMSAIYAQNTASTKQNSGYLRYKVGHSESVTRVLQALRLNPIYGRNGILQKTLNLNEGRIKKKGNLVLTGTELLLPIKNLGQSDDYYVERGYVYIKNFPKKSGEPAPVPVPANIPAQTEIQAAPAPEPIVEQPVKTDEPIKVEPTSEPFKLPVELSPQFELSVSVGAGTFTAVHESSDGVASGEVETPRSYSVPMLGVEVAVPLLKMTHTAKTPAQFGFQFSSEAGYEFSSDNPNLGVAWNAFGYGFIRWVKTEYFEINTAAGYGLQNNRQITVDATSPTTDENGDPVEPETAALQTKYRGPAILFKLGYEKFAASVRYLKISSGTVSGPGATLDAKSGSQIAYQLSADKLLPFELGLWLRFETAKAILKDDAGKTSRSTVSAGVSRAFP